MKLLWHIAVSLALAAAPAAAQEIAGAAPDHVFKLERILAEISGLAVASPTTVFAHNDEYAIIHEIDIDTGVIIRSFALGTPTAQGDFEGVTLSGEFIYLLTSNGMLYEAKPVAHAKRSAFNVYDTGLGDTCEFEGLAATSEEGEFLLLCKLSRLAEKRDRLIIYKWSIDDRLKPVEPWLNAPLAGLAPTPDKGYFKAAGLDIDPESGDIMVIDSNSGAVLELSPDGAFRNYRQLQAGGHPQAEGIALMANGALVIGDEGGRKAGRLTVYPPQQ